METEKQHLALTQQQIQQEMDRLLRELGLMRENVKDFCKVAGYFINGYFTKRW